MVYLITFSSTKVNAHSSKPPRPLNYPCHICGIRPQIDKIFKVWENANLFMDEGGKITNNKLIANIKVVIASINMVDVHVTT